MNRKKNGGRELPQGRSLTAHESSFLENRQSIYDQLRSHAPRYQDNEYGRTLLTKFDDVRLALKNPTFSVKAKFSREDSYLRRLAATGLESYEGGTAYEPPLVLLDDPDHRRVRTLINKFFTPNAVKNMAVSIENIASELLDAFDNKKEVDLITDYAAPLSTLVMIKMLGLPANVAKNMRKWSEAVLMGYDPERNSIAKKDLRIAFIEMGKIFKKNLQVEENIAERNLISVMVQAKEKEGLLSELEIISLCTQLMGAGNVTTSDLIGNGLFALMNDRKVLESLLQNPNLLDRAVEEMLRFDCPISETGRVARQSTQINDHLIDAHETVTASLSAANHDPKKFPKPSQFRLDRLKNDHLAFGSGIHFCIGAALARLETKIAIRELLSRHPKIRLNSKKVPVRRTLPFFSGFTSITVDLPDNN